MPVREFLAKNKTVIMLQPPYSPDVANADFFLFPKLKISIKGKHFVAICNKVVRSIRNTTLKLCGDCAKQFVRKAQNCGKTQSWILNNDNAAAHTSMLVREFYSKNKAVIMNLSLYSSDLDPADFFLFPITEDTNKGKRFATIEEMKRKIKTGAVSEVFRGLEKTKGGYFAEDKILTYLLNLP